MSTVHLSQITKQFGKVTAVKNLDLVINEGEFFTFLGPSGCGKTTTLRMIAGFYYPTEGVVKFNEKDMTTVPPEKRNTGMVFQNYALFPHMTVYENVAFGLKVRKISKKETKQRVESVLEKVRLKEYINRQVSQLSGGQQQRVALARALVIEPDILLLDEPLSNLDARLRDEMRAELLRLQREFGITTVYVTHDQVEALTMSDRIAVFNFGECQQVGTPTEIYNKPVNDFVAQFIGETNLLPIIYEKTIDSQRVYRYKETSIYVNESSHNIAKYQETDELYISVRPEAVIISENKIEGNNVFEGVIDLVQFTGESLHLLVKIDDNTTIRVTELNQGIESYKKEGTKVYVQLPENRVRVVPKMKE
ncbi:iron(III) transport system ATP-binding protein [Cerasibacillus quisquiliarum]|uniref:Spermidine/putrescine import ATP-binding protein PotA n=1 Tax=Cerasibacillus quisquiliarum TaxID=227865 RepID=A0A511UW45_9BACI|nr:ABC transporter ATP-binding protein [Cerasibacillus quisquiliarum]MBB5146125.1 iron(III) transport system ATP-binding protein [Cerasibacillus quisquiliarum]GEN30860.1 polyamine ABC transporter ATP-binding protein [Cerasibacillus quisquiliarum]